MNAHLHSMELIMVDHQKKAKCNKNNYRIRDTLLLIC